MGFPFMRESALDKPNALIPESRRAPANHGSVPDPGALDPKEADPNPDPPNPDLLRSDANELTPDARPNVPVPESLRGDPNE